MDEICFMQMLTKRNREAFETRLFASLLKVFGIPQMLYVTSHSHCPSAKLLQLYTALRVLPFSTLFGFAGVADMAPACECQFMS